MMQNFIRNFLDKTCYIIKLTVDLLVEIALLISMKEYCSLIRTCQTIKVGLSDYRFWRKKVQQLQNSGWVIRRSYLQSNDSNNNSICPSWADSWKEYCMDLIPPISIISDNNISNSIISNSITNKKIIQTSRETIYEIPEKKHNDNLNFNDYASYTTYLNYVKIRNLVVAHNNDMLCRIKHFLIVFSFSGKILKEIDLTNFTGNFINNFYGMTIDDLGMIYVGLKCEFGICLISVFNKNYDFVRNIELKEDDDNKITMESIAVSNLYNEIYITGYKISNNNSYTNTRVIHVYKNEKYSFTTIVVKTEFEFRDKLKINLSSDNNILYVCSDNNIAFKRNECGRFENTNFAENPYGTFFCFYPKNHIVHYYVYGDYICVGLDDDNTNNYIKADNNHGFDDIIVTFNGKIGLVCYSYWKMKIEWYN
jgi:hypothetical protein